MNIQQAAKASGLTADTIRFYERKQILPGPGRASNGYRHYTADHIVILRLARGLRHLGVPLAEIPSLIGVAHDGSCFQVRDSLVSTLTKAISATDRQMDDLAQLREHMARILTGLMAMGDDSKVPGIEPCNCVRIVSDA